VWGLDSESTTVTVTDLTSGESATPTPAFPSGWYGSYSYLSFEPGGGFGDPFQITAGHDYEVTVSNVRYAGGDPPQDLVYVIELVDCSEF